MKQPYRKAPTEIRTSPHAQPSTVVLLDDVREWVDLLRNTINGFPTAAHFTIESFTNDHDATHYVRSHRTDIIGYIQDMNRDPFIRLETGEGPAGIRFLNEVIIPLTPWAKTIVVSGQASIRLVHDLFRSASPRLYYITKYGFDLETFQRAFQWMLRDEGVPEADWGLLGPKDTYSELVVPELTALPQWDELRQYVAHHPEFLHTMDPRLFEELVGEIFRSYGWQVELTARTRDGGFDIIAIRRTDPTNLRILVEAKRLSPERPLGVGVVRALYSTKIVQGASQVVIATSTYVSADAKREFSRVIPWELDFMERDKILDWCKRSGAVYIKGDLA